MKTLKYRLKLGLIFCRIVAYKKSVLPENVEYINYYLFYTRYELC